MAATWKGSEPALTGRHEKWTAGDQYTAELREYKEIHEGSRANIVAMLATYAPGYTMFDLEGQAVTIESVEIDPTGEADKNRITISASNRAALIEAETEWTRSEEDIRLSPAYSGLSADDRQQILYVLGGKIKTLTTPWARSDLSGDIARACYDDLASGKTTFRIKVPVVRKTQYLLTCPSAGSVPSTPTVPYPSGYTWDGIMRTTRQGLYWVTCTEWEGTPT